MRSERALRAGIGLLAVLWLVPWMVQRAPEPAVPGRPAGEGVERLLWGERLDPNLAPQAALRTLPGIGPVRAAGIVAERPFCHASELLRVRGIGPVTWSRIRDSLEVRDLPMECESERRAEFIVSDRDG